MIRWPAVVFTAFAVSACTVNVRSPKVAFSEVERDERQNFEVIAAFNSSVFRLPGLTWSIAGTYLPGRRSRFSPAMPLFAFDGSLSKTYKLTISATAECRPAQSTVQLLSSSLNKMWDYSGGLPSTGRVEVNIVSADVRVSRYAMSLNKGRKFRLAYWVPCIENDANTALFYGAMIALHESTHASLSMAGAESKDAFERERIAVGAEACLYLAVRSKDEAFTSQHAELLNRFKQQDQTRLGTAHIDLTKLCEAWKDSVSSARLRQH